MVKIIIDGVEVNVAGVQEAIDALYRIKKEQILSKPSRCHKCVFEFSCPNIDINGSCKSYKRDPPDGGYYG